MLLVREFGVWTELGVTSGAPIGYRRRQSVGSNQSATAFDWPDVTYADFIKLVFLTRSNFFSPPSECEVDRADETKKKVQPGVRFRDIRLQSRTFPPPPFVGTL